MRAILANSSPIMSSAASRCPRYHLLDPLRGVAIGCVLASHFTAPGVASSMFHDLVVPATRHGYVGVALFFVISGYCIAGAAERAGESVRPAAVFLRHRFRRIFPPYWWSILLAVALALGTVFLGGRTWESIFPLNLRDWLLNIILLQGPFGAGDIQTVYWSLTIELQFYLVVGCLLLAPVRIEWLVAWIGIVSGLLRPFPAINLDGTFLAHWGQFSAGMACFYWLYNARSSRRAAVVMLLATALSAAVAVYTNPNPFQWPGSFPRPLIDALAIAVSVFLIALYGSDEKICRWRAVTWLAWAGTISYSLYLTHNLVGGRVMNIGTRLTGLEGWWWLVFCIAALAVSLGVGVVFFHLCEKPWLRSRQQT